MAKLCMEYEMAKQCHRELWTWLANNPDKVKRDWPGWGNVTTIYGHIKSNCFACKVASEEAARRGVADRLTRCLPGAILTSGSYSIMCPHCPVTVWRDPE